MTNIYALNKDGSPLTPIHSHGKARRMSKAGKARVVCCEPFTLRPTCQIDDPEVDGRLLGIDPGRTNVGLCAVDSKGRVLFASDVVTCNKEIGRLMLARRWARRASRRGERKAHQRRAASADKTGTAKATEF